MTLKNKSNQSVVVDKKISTLITSDMVLDLYTKAKGAKGLEKKALMDKVIFLSQNLNHYIPIVVSQYSV